MSEIGRTQPLINLPNYPNSNPNPNRETPDQQERSAQADITIHDSLVSTPAVAYTAATTPFPELRSGCVIGLDGGGTKVNAAVADLDAVVLGGGTAGPCNVAAMTAVDAFASARAACLAALVTAGRLPEDVLAICAGVAGVSHVQRRSEFEHLMQELFPNARVAVDPDYATAFSGATGGAAGIVVIAGTGSVAYGEDGRGRSCKTGAYGYIIDDAGSGYGVGREAIAAVLRAADRTGPETTLLERVLEALGIGDVAAVIPEVYGGSIGRAKIASLAAVVAEAAETDTDEVAISILSNAGASLARLVTTVIGELFSATTDPYPVAMVGSLWKAGNAITVPFVRSIRQAAPSAVLAPPREGPLQGALRRAHALAR